MKVRLRDGTGTRDYRYLVEDMDRHGNVRVYFRRKGFPKIRLRETPGTPEFEAEYRDALDAPVAATRKRPPVGRGSLRWLVERYYGSADYKRLGTGTQTPRRGILDALCEKNGAKPYGLMEKRHVLQIRDEKTDFPEAANARVKALRQVFKWAIDAEITDKNPAQAVPYLSSNNPNGWHTWTVAEVERYIENHPIGTKAYKALAIGLFVGVRRSDAVQLGSQMERDGAVYFTETKGRERNPKDRVLPILPELREALDAAPSGHLTYLVTEFGKPFTANGFGNWFRKRCNEARLPHCSFHGLRKAGATIAADNGATEHQLMAIYGWTTTKQAALYTRKANRKKLAKDAMHLVVPDQEENKSVPLLEGGAGSGTKKGKKA